MKTGPQPKLFETIERLEENIKSVEGQLRGMVEGDRTVELLMAIPGCGEICAWTIRAYTDDIKRFAGSKKYAPFAGLAPWVQNSNEKVRHGSITKRGPKELRTALAQAVMGLRRMKQKTFSWRFMQRYEAMKKSKRSGKAIIATARKIAVVIWHMLTGDEEFNMGLTADRKLAEKSESMSGSAGQAKEPMNEEREKPVPVVILKKSVKKAGVAGAKRKKVG
jgi:hypothetical protein